MLAGRCHCGAVKFELATMPKWLTSCNCSYCQRSGALWAHAAIDDVVIAYLESGIVRYVHGDKTIAFISCRTCGCTTHWEPLDEEKHPRMALNLNMVASDQIGHLRVRRFDGADSWSYLD